MILMNKNGRTSPSKIFRIQGPPAGHHVYSDLLLLADFQTKLQLCPHSPDPRQVSLSNPNRSLRSSISHLTVHISPSTPPHHRRHVRFFIYPFLVLREELRKGGKNPRAPMEEQRRVGRTAAELTFWTLCPYCYYAHEYEKAYEECCVRCANCRRGFHAAAIRAPAEHKGAGGGGYYDCRLGLFPLRYDWCAREDEEVEDYLVEISSSGDKRWESQAKAGHVNAGAEEEGEGMEEESCGGELEFEYEGDEILVSA
ncbi:uncharacterized protein LOC115738997 [Rhodamnia argentea]|uniref:Uncharacterized protein LOC115738997 n=1 Tax=Rhodamnia argentea TaxID=178133 RepID=A0A8B8NYR1_9MYRT|nr:uncharacterized protein LOC115738997 [Rhodamnia argentea]